MKNNYLLFLALISFFSSYSQEIKMCGYQGYQTVEEVTSACDLQDATRSNNNTEGAEQVVDNILDKVGLFRNFLIEECDNINNALAVTMPLDGGNIDRYILYDIEFFKKVSSSTGTDWGLTSILAHEVGHHLNGHTLKSGGSNHKVELQADEFSGFVLARMNCSLEDAQSAVSNLLPDEASSTHPAKKDRLAAIEKGWNRGNGKTITVKKIENVKKEIESEDDEKKIASSKETMAEAILGRHIETIGGEENIRNIKTLYTKSTKKYDSEEVETEIWYQSPNKKRVNSKTVGHLYETWAIADMKYIYTKTSQFKSTPWGKMKNRSKAFKNSYINELSDLINMQGRVYDGVSTINGQEYYTVKFAHEEIVTGNDNINYKHVLLEKKIFDIESNLLKILEFSTETYKMIDGKSVKIYGLHEIRYLSNYKQVNGVLFHFTENTIVKRFGSKDVNVKKVFDEIIVNPEIDKHLFVTE